MSAVKQVYLTELIVPNPQTKGQLGKAIDSKSTFGMIDLSKERQLKCYMKIERLKEFWISIYDEFVFHSMHERDDKIVKNTRDEIYELIKQFDREMNTLSGVLKSQKKTVLALQKLKEALGKPPKNTSEKELTNYTMKIRNLSTKVTKSIDVMQQEVAVPGIIKRAFTRLWGSPSILISPDRKESYLLAADSAMRGFSRVLAEKLMIPKDVVHAMEVLDLPANTTKDEVNKRYRYLIKLAHPDTKTGSKNDAIRLNRARETLLKHFEISRRINPQKT